MTTLKETIGELHKCFDGLNKALFSGELPTPAITIASQGKRACYGWCSNEKIWRVEDNTEHKYEINLSAEHICRDIHDIAQTMLHEMVHLFGNVKDIQTTSRGGTYHNKKYKDLAESHGLTVEKSDKYGYCVTHLTPETRKLIDSMALSPKAFSLARMGEGLGEETEEGEEEKKEKKKSSQVKYTCPSCGLIVRVTERTRIVKLLCMDCKVLLEPEEGALLPGYEENEESEENEND